MIAQPTPTHQLKPFTVELINRMNTQLRSLTLETSDEVSLCQKSIEVTYQTSEELRRFIQSHQFKNIEQEILFFRKLKPSITSQFIYFKQRLALKLNEPFLEEERKKFREDHFRKIQSFRLLHNAFYTYCNSPETCFDTQYFSRQSKFQNPDYDRNFSTGYDTLYATLLANDELKKHLLDQTQSRAGSEQQTSLTWTAPKASLIELIYALKETDVFNDGKADLKQIATELERMFHISLGNYYRVFQDIRLRKSGQSNFLDTLKNKFIERCTEMD